MINQLCRSFESSSPLILSKIKVIQECHFDSLLQCLDSLNSPFLNRYTQPNPQCTPLDKNPQEPPVVEDKTRRFYSHNKPHKPSPTRNLQFRSMDVIELITNPQRKNDYV